MKNNFSLTFLFCCILLFGNAQLYSYKNFNHRSGLNYGSINCISQSSDGYLWLGTDGGELVRFDGENFHELDFKENSNHTFNNIYCHGDTVLFASFYKGFFQYSKKQDILTPLVDKNDELGRSLAIFCSDSITYMIGSKGILTKIDDDYSVKIRFKKNDDLLKIHQIIKADGLFIVTTSNGNYVFENGKVLQINSWLKDNQNDFNDLQFGYYSNKELFLFDEKFTRRLQIELNKDGTIISKKEEALTLIFGDNETPISTSYNLNSNIYGVLTNTGNLYKYDNEALHSIIHNYLNPLTSPSSILTDINGNFWVSSELRGIYKISNEPFTKIQLDPIYLLPNIKFSHRTIYGDVIVSTMDNKTFSANTNYQNKFKEFDLQVVGIGSFGDSILAGTNNGVYKFISGENQELNPFLF